MLIPLSNEIKRRRLEMDLSKRKLSIKAGLPANAVCRLEGKKYKYVHPIRAQALAKALECNIYDVFKKT